MEERAQGTMRTSFQNALYTCAFTRKASRRQLGLAKPYTLPTSRLFSRLRMALSRREQEELQPLILETVTQRLGFPEKAVMKASLSCLTQNFDREQTVEQLTALLGQDLAPRFVEDLFNRIDRARSVVDLILFGGRL